MSIATLQTHSHNTDITVEEQIIHGIKVPMLVIRSAVIGDGKRYTLPMRRFILREVDSAGNEVACVAPKDGDVVITATP